MRHGIGKRDKKNKGFDQCKKQSEIKRILSFYNVHIIDETR